MKQVLIAGATGYLGRHLCAEFQDQGWHVSALVRRKSAARDLRADTLIEAQATRPETLQGIMAGCDLVVSALGITRQADGVGYWDVDYQANLNLLNEALRADVQHFAFVHVLNADRMQQVPLVAAKSAFVRILQNAPLRSTVIAPTGYFSDMGDFLAMAKTGRVWLFGTGSQQINPIHGADLARASFEAIAQREDWVDVGGPEIFTQDELARLSFDALNTPARIIHLPDILRRATLWLLPRFTPRRIAGPAEFFLTALALNMTARPFGTRRLSRHFQKLAGTDETSAPYPVELR